ncbi:DUF6126 family protein [Streptomyces sp. NPDC012623]|uniref:DUF6126 family protein n=1 Tax=unclassified Streptomyces TaxID=2593676 RepID=UPI0036BC72D7
MSETEKTAPSAEPAEPLGPESPAAGAPPRAPDRVMDEEKTFPMGLVIRLFAYLVAGHVLAFFLYLLFTVGAKG